MSKPKKKERRGGARVAGPGKLIGRPPSTGETKSVALSLRITPTLAAWIDAERGDLSRNEFVESALRADSRFAVWANQQKKASK